jgi:hypothetical protein
MVMCSGCVACCCCMVLLYGVVVWCCFMVLLYGGVVWWCCMVVLYGGVVWVVVNRFFNASTFDILTFDILMRWMAFFHGFDCALVARFWTVWVVKHRTCHRCSGPLVRRFFRGLPGCGCCFLCRSTNRKTSKTPNRKKADWSACPVVLCRYGESYDEHIEVLVSNNTLIFSRLLSAPQRNCSNKKSSMPRPCDA